MTPYPLRYRFARGSNVHAARATGADVTMTACGNPITDHDHTQPPSVAVTCPACQRAIRLETARTPVPVTKGQTYRCCIPGHDLVIYIEDYQPGSSRATISTMPARSQYREIDVQHLHPSPVHPSGHRRGRGYALITPQEQQ